ncbi:MAG: M23 family metallopeptidase [Clostridia bacterium]|nr:M23 family metallopeptidase [Clostridia bacterium]
MTIKFQSKAGLTKDGSFGPTTIKKMKNVLNSFKSTQNNTSDKYNLIWPTTNKTVTGKYGTHGSTRSNGTRYHSGIDIGSKVGDPCYAAADGVVIMCKTTDDATSTIGGRGRYIVIYHSNGNFSSLYEHLNSVSVSNGQTVKAGQRIGTTGNSGWQAKNQHYAAHLHFGLMYGKMTNMGYDLWTVPGKTYNGKTYSNNTFEPDPAYNKNISYQYK